MIGVKIWKHFGKEICGQKKQSTMIYLSNIFCIAIASRDSSSSTGSVSIPLGKSLDKDIISVLTKDMTKCCIFTIN